MCQALLDIHEVQWADCLEKVDLVERVLPFVLGLPDDAPVSLYSGQYFS